MYGSKKIAALCISKADRYTDFISSLNDTLEKIGFKLMIFHTCSDLFWNNKVEKSEKTVFDLIDYSFVDAIIVYKEAFHDKETVDRIIRAADKNKKPVLVIGEKDENHISLLFDYCSGFEMIVFHILEYHKKTDLHLIAGVKGESHSEERIDVFRRVLRDNNIELTEDMVSYGDYWHMPTAEAVNALIQSGHIPEAIICVNDAMAITVCEELEKSNIKVPSDVLVTGFDGIKEAAYCDPPITTCKYNMDMLAEKTAELIDRLIDEYIEPTVFYIGFTPLIYSSCGCTGSAAKMNFSSILKKTQDHFNGFREKDRTLHELIESSVMCETSADIIERLNSFGSGKNVLIAINKSCFDSSINPVNEIRENSFDENMILACSPVTSGNNEIENFRLSELIPLIFSRLKGDYPVIVTALGFMGTPFGFIVSDPEPSFEAYSSIPQSAEALNTIIGCNRNVRYIRYTSGQIKKMAMLDNMTGLYNRSGFYSHLKEITDSALNSGRHILVVSADADRLKLVNDTYGHNCGDFIITTAAEAVMSISLGEKICGRFGGDEFAVCGVTDDPDNAESLIADEIQAFVNRVNASSGKPFEVSVSIGAVVCRADNFDFDPSYREADRKMYENKSAKGVNRR